MTDATVRTTNLTDAQRTRRLQTVLRWERRALLAYAEALVLALPFALLAADGVLFAAGVAYAVLYATAMVVPTALYILMIFDAARVLTGRRAVFMPLLIAMGKVASEERDAPRRQLARHVVSLTVDGNLLAPISRELWLVAFRFHRSAVGEIDLAAETLAKELRAAGMTGRLVAAEVRTVPHRGSEIELMTLVAC